MTDLSLPQRMGAKLVHGLTKLIAGHSPAGLSEEWIGTMGVLGFLRFSMQATKTLGRLSREYGEANAQFIAGLSAAWNGCGFCGYGHVLTGALIYFREHDRVHPLHPEAIECMLDGTDEEAVAYLDALLDTEPHQRLRWVARRMYELKMGRAEPGDAEDELLLAAVWLWTWTVECTINLGMTIEPEDAVPYLHPIYKDGTLRVRYDRARAPC